MIYESQINIARKNYSYKCAPLDSTRGLLQKMSHRSYTEIQEEPMSNQR